MITRFFRMEDQVSCVVYVPIIEHHHLGLLGFYILGYNQDGGRLHRPISKPSKRLSEGLSLRQDSTDCHNEDVV